MFKCKKGEKIYTYNVYRIGLKIKKDIKDKLVEIAKDNKLSLNKLIIKEILEKGI